jgi:hypothetical protein
MKPITIVGIVLILGGVTALVFGGITYSKNGAVLDVRGLQLEATTKESVPIAQIAAILAAVAGIGLVVVGARSKS